MNNESNAKYVPMLVEALNNVQIALDFLKSRGVFDEVSAYSDSTLENCLTWTEDALNQLPEELRG